MSWRRVSVAKHIRRMSIRSGGLMISNLQTFVETASKESLEEENATGIDS